MSIDQLTKRIENGLKEGKSLDSLRQSLIDEGNNKLDVDIAVSHVSNSSSFKINKKVLYIVLGVVVLAALVFFFISLMPATDDSLVVENDSFKEEVNNSEQEVEIPEFIPIPISESDFSSFKIDKLRYLYYESPDEYGDRSALRKVPGVYMYDAHMEVWYSYFLPSHLDNADIYLKILGRSTTDELDTVQFSAPLKDDGDIIDFVSGLKNSQENPRLNYCFGFGADFDPSVESEFVYCTIIVGTSPSNNLVGSSSKLFFDFDADDASAGDVLNATDYVHVTNSGSTPLTIFAAFEDIEDQEIVVSSDDLPLDLGPGMEEKITFTAQFSYEGVYAKDADAYIYALPSNCEPSFDCAQTAKVDISLEADYEI